MNTTRKSGKKEAKTEKVEVTLKHFRARDKWGRDYHIDAEDHAGAVVQLSQQFKRRKLNYPVDIEPGSFVEVKK